MYGGTTREDPEDTVSVRWYVWGTNSGGGMYGGTIRDPPEDTVSVRWYVWGDNSGGSRGHCVCEVVLIPSILSIPDTVSVRWYVWGDNSGGSRVYLVFRTLCL